MIAGFALHNLFLWSKFMFWAYQNHLLHLLALGVEDYPAGLHQIKLKKQV